MKDTNIKVNGLLKQIKLVNHQVLPKQINEYKVNRLFEQIKLINHQVLQKQINVRNKYKINGLLKVTNLERIQVITMPTYVLSKITRIFHYFSYSLRT